MSESNYTDDALNVQNGTEPGEVRSFVMKRASNPIKIQGNIIWNFNNHKVRRDLLEQQVDNFYYDEFIIPFQAPGAWGYMVRLLPKFIREAEILAYDQSRERYNPYPNFRRHSENDVDQEIKRQINNQVRDEL